MPVFAKRRHLAVLLLLCPLAASAQQLPRPAEFYFDADAVTTRALVAVSDQQGEALAAQLAKYMERGRKSVEAAAQLARIAFQSNREDLGKLLYQQALDRSGGPTGALGRAVAWAVGLHVLIALLAYTLLLE